MISSAARPIALEVETAPVAAAPAPAGPAYRPDLDGLRAIAVGLVILTHAKWPWVNNGGDAGVTAFFVLSGFLITSILVGQQERTGRIDVLAFYRRRIVRLAPAMLGLLGFTLVLGLAIGWPTQWQVGLASCLVYVSNWVQVAGANIDPLGHTWSLAIEEQFYLLWPAVLILFRGQALRVAVIGIAAASVLRIVATGPFEYFSTVTRADAILVGCVLAYLRPRWHPGVALIGVVGLVVVALLDPVHDVAIPATMVATAAVIGGRFEPLGVLAPIGLRAYSLYLWNWPMTLLFGPIGVLGPLMTVLVAEVSYRLLEAPVLRRGGRRLAVAPMRPAPSEAGVGG
jgi:peptidoglycan/LPS O-acetylase OafA/YrhL